ncbi:unnamed protein product [Anisakis simplex]|uniref:Receptor expression-enhancing protein n=1 Tax=Anisakis simplex TaxID=6269 RepID=A0A0M3J0A6_ANISI|nr:unnamed protein product [Anisakis simplex]
MSAIEIHSSNIKETIDNDMIQSSDTRSSLLPSLNPQLLDFLYDVQNDKLNDDLRRLEIEFGINREQVAYVAIGFIAVYLMIGKDAGLLCNLIGFVYPAIASIIAMEMDIRYDIFLWLLYWMCYGLYAILDLYAETIMDVLPIYWLSKVCDR